MSRYLYLAPLVDFLAAVDGDTLVDELTRRHQEVTDVLPGAPEVKSWQVSLPALAGILRDPAFATGEIFVELFMPLNGRRCDALLTGHTAGGPAAVIVELKQWTFVQTCHLSDHVHAGGRNVLHPSVQVRDYVERMSNYHSAFTGGGEPIELSGAVFLHDLPLRGDKAGLRDPGAFGTMPQDFPLFLEHEHQALAQWLARRLVPGPGKPVADRIRRGAPLPSPKLLDRLVEYLKGQKDWQLLDEQKTAYATIQYAVRKSRMTGEKRVFIVRGGPGTGKSVLAIQLLADAARGHWKVAHATGSKAFQTVLQGRTQAFSLQMMKKIHNVKTKKALPVSGLFATFAEVARLGAAEPDRLELVICDEAHRLWKHRRIKYPNGMVKWLSETFMVDEVMAASRVSVFFLDDNQSVRAGEIGRSALIEQRCEALGLPCEVHDLDAQFRCAGSTSYIHWVEGVLGFRPGLDHEWLGEQVYVARVWEEMAAMDAHLRGLAREGRRCRLLAAYCWRWSKPDKLGRLPHDLTDPRFGGWSGAWIEKTGQNLTPLQNQYYRWATLDSAYEQVGSIYSVQGFEFDDIGLIWGDDLVWRGNGWVAQIGENKDGAFKRELRTSGTDPVAKLLNVYRVLLTRGMLSTHLFILDDETRAHVQACLVPRAVAVAVAAGQAPVAPPREGRGMGLTRRHFSPRPLVPPAERPWTVGVPLLDFHAAAGGFSGTWHDLIDLAQAEEWVTWAGAPGFQPGDFVARVRGDSMSPAMADGDWCLFRPTPIEASVGLPALVRLDDADSDGVRFTVKVVRVEWAPGEDGEMVRTRLTLESDNPAYPPIRFNSETQHVVRVLAVVRRVLGQRT